MPWKVDPYVHTTFARNPLVVVVAQIRFHPILKIGGYVDDFQDQVRGRFPAFERTRAVALDIQDFTRVHVEEEDTFTFRREEDRATMVLARGGLTVEHQTYSTRKRLQADLALGWAALQPVRPQTIRLGLRYVNVIRRSQIEADLRREVTWGDLVATDGFRAFGSDRLDDDMYFTGEVSGPVPQAGAMTLRYGKLPGLHPPASAEFRVDVDRYLDGYTADEEPEALCDRFANDAFSTFRRFAGQALDEWMSGR